MEKRVMGIFWQPCVGLILFAFTAIMANAQVLNNPGFETAGNKLYVPGQWGWRLSHHLEYFRRGLDAAWRVVRRPYRRPTARSQAPTRSLQLAMTT